MLLSHLERRQLLSLLKIRIKKKKKKKIRILKSPFSFLQHIYKYTYRTPQASELKCIMAS